MRATPLERWTAADPYLALLVHRAVLDAQAAVDDEARDALRIALERLSHALAALGEAEEVGDARAPKELAQWLAAALEVPQRDLADLLGVDLRRFQRWISTRERTRPEGEEARRLRALARLVGPAPARFHAGGRRRLVRLAAARAGRRDAARAASRSACACPTCCWRPVRRGAPRSREGASIVAYRLASWRRPLRTEPSRVAGRFHRVTEESPTQYLCLHPLGPWAEFLRRSGLRTPEQLALVRHRTWALRLDPDGLVRIGFAEAAEHGLRPATSSPTTCARATGSPTGCAPRECRGAIVPSAALPGTDNVVLFGARAAAPYPVEPVSRVDVPASLTADGGRPPLGILDRVRRRGARHALLEAWRAGEPFRFVEPSWAEWPVA